MYGGKQCEFCRADMYWRHENTICKQCDEILALQEKQIKLSNKASKGRSCKCCSKQINGPNYFFCTDCQTDNKGEDINEYSIPGVILR